MARAKNPASVAAEIRRILKRDGSAEHAKGVQWFFKEEIQSHGWYAADLRRLARNVGRSIQKEFGLDFLVQVADQLFAGDILEEKLFAILLLEKLTSSFENAHFELFESWIGRISSWADHDALAHYLLGPMMVLDPTRVRKTAAWAKARSRWHRRAACVSLIQGTRKRNFFPQITKLANALLRDEDDMVQKGLGWLLRETAKADPERVVPYLLKIRGRCPRLVLRTACETLPKDIRHKVLSS